MNTSAFILISGSYNGQVFCVHNVSYYHISGDGGLVLVDLEQEPHRAQDWSELPFVRYIQSRTLSVSFHVAVSLYYIGGGR